MKLKVPINKIPLPDKAYSCKFECVDIGFNRCLNELEQCEILFSEEHLLKTINTWDEYFNITDEAKKDLIKAIIAAMPEILTIKKGE